jgi:mannose-1-phosphate guanylyltransferase/mannose-1-phosphate guanylyltransferase/mannose-6-phosphate isomerase
MFTDCLIMAGGSGTRLWPASNRKRPKQFLSIPGGKSFFASAVDRALALIDREQGRVIIIAGQSHVPHIIEECAALEAADRERLVLIPEPLARNTAPAVACGALYAEKALGKNRTMLVLTSDHLIGPRETFVRDAAAAARAAGQDKLAVFGIPPRKPETGYGYIEAAEPLSGERVFRAASFREKPDRQRAEEFLASGNFYWNSGMFAFSTAFILGEFRRHAPECLLPLEALGPPPEDAYETRRGLRVLAAWDGLPEAYAAVKAVSFDYAIAEKCERTVMVAAAFDWYDVGSWDEYAQILGTSSTPVFRAGRPALAEVPVSTTAPAATTALAVEESCFVDADMPVALCGVEDLIVVIRSGADGGPPVALIAKKGETQGVKDIVDQLKAAGREDLL